MQTNTELLSRIVVNEKILTGKPIVRGFRISVEQILKALASGNSEKEILQNFPELESDDIRACLLYAANILEDEKIYKVA